MASFPLGVEVPGVMSLCHAGGLRRRAMRTLPCGGGVPSDSSAAPCMDICHSASTGVKHATRAFEPFYSYFLLCYEHIPVVARPNVCHADAIASRHKCAQGCIDSQAVHYPQAVATQKIHNIVHASSVQSMLMGTEASCSCSDSRRKADAGVC